MTEPTELLPCPFCGAAAHFEMDEGRWEWVECESCGMQGNRSASLMEDCKPMLAEAWNTRAKWDQPVHSGEPEVWHDPWHGIPPYTAPQPTRAGAVESAEFDQFLSDVLTAAGLVTHGKQCKALGERLADMCMKLRLHKIKGGQHGTE